MSSKVGQYCKSLFLEFLSLGGQYFTVYSLGAIFYSIITRANTGKYTGLRGQYRVKYKYLILKNDIIIRLMGYNIHGNIILKIL